MSHVGKAHHAGVTSVSLLSAPTLQRRPSKNPVIDFATAMLNDRHHLIAAVTACYFCFAKISATANALTL